MSPGGRGNRTMIAAPRVQVCVRSEVQAWRAMVPAVVAVLVPVVKVL